MADSAIVGVLLSHLGRPSMLIRGQKTALPGDDKVGMMLAHVNPSLAARLSRKTLARHCGPNGSLHTNGSAARLAHSSVGRVKTRAVIGGEHLAPAAGASHAAYRARPADACQVSSQARAYSEQIHTASGADPSAAPQRSQRTWPWNQPLPPDSASPAVVTQYVSPPPALGDLLDLIA